MHARGQLAEEHLARKGLGLPDTLVDHEPLMSPCGKGDEQPSGSNAFFSALVKFFWSAGSSFGLLRTKEVWTYWSKSMKGNKDH